MGRVSTTVLKGVSFTASKGEFLGILGPSGSGKSTLIMLLAGIDTPDKGKVVVDGVEVSSLPPGARSSWRRRNVGIVFQFFHLIPTLTALENLLLGMEVAGVRKDRDRAIGLLRFVGLEDKADRFPAELSGGEQQRVAIARALAHNPKLLLADEPTANLDYENKIKVVKLLRMAADKGTTVVFATHDQHLVEEADRIVEVRDGRVTRVVASV
ncbi:antimicrobial peptide ABC transporter ATP-binding protein [Aeropyrum pernix]|uniref:Antimicrobial peptide ABC transporter ATP-binding protein n=2 Tax=Aeropyrum pernix TaxID=56636 RepID=A0A401H9L3_AERPX|nr:antimicrobial peptide ABC transporter ATP-binding protein [Aeropyrum pernix]